MLFVIFLVMTFFVQNGFSTMASSIEKDRIFGHIDTPNGFSWNYGYDIEFKDQEIIVRVAVNLIAGNGVSKPALDQVIPDWEKEIEHIWSRRFCVKTLSEKYYPVVVDVVFKGVQFHHDVIVRSGGSGCCSTELNWRIVDAPISVAHEFGHMLGNYDEYKKGAVDPVNKTIDPTSIMTSNPVKGVAYPRHFQRILDWFKESTGSDNMVLQAMDRQSTI